MTDLSAFLTKPDAWFLGFPTTDMAYAEAQHLLDSCPDVNFVLIWPANKRTVNSHEGWAVLFAADLIEPNYYVVSRQGYDPVEGLSK